MTYLYTLLFSLSIILINPWGASRGSIWTQPKVFVVLLITLLNLAILSEEKEDGRIPRMRAALLHIDNKQARAAA
jgi:hypothetical protein